LARTVGYIIVRNAFTDSKAFNYDGACLPVVVVLQTYSGDVTCAELQTWDIVIHYAGGTTLPCSLLISHTLRLLFLLHSLY